MTTTTLLAITFDCADPERLARFWAAAMGREIDPIRTPGFATIGHAEAARPFWVFQQVEEPRAGTNRVHADLNTDDLAGETRRLLALGATLVREVAGNSVTFNTLLDPEGNTFDLAAE